MRIQIEVFSNVIQLPASLDLYDWSQNFIVNSDTPPTTWVERNTPPDVDLIIITNVSKTIERAYPAEKILEIFL